MSLYNEPLQRLMLPNIRACSRVSSIPVNYDMQLESRNREHVELRAMLWCTDCKLAGHGATHMVLSVIGALVASIIVVLGLLQFSKLARKAICEKSTENTPQSQQEKPLDGSEE